MMSPSNRSIVVQESKRDKQQRREYSFSQKSMQPTQILSIYKVKKQVSLSARGHL